MLFLKMWAIILAQYALLVAAVLATAFAVRSVLRRFGFLNDHSISIRRVPDGYQTDGGVGLERLNRRWEFYDAAFPIVLWALYALMKYLNARMVQP